MRFYQPFFSIRAAGNKVAWNRTTPDLRWGFRSYSDVVVLDTDSGRMRELTHKAKLFAPAPSPNGARIAAIKFGPDRHCHLVLLDTTSGTEQARFSAPDGVLWREPAWSAGRALYRRGAAGRTRQHTRAQLTLPMGRDRSCCRTPMALSVGPSSGVLTCCLTPPIQASTISTLSTCQAVLVTK